MVASGVGSEVAFVKLQSALIYPTNKNADERAMSAYQAISLNTALASGALLQVGSVYGVPCTLAHITHVSLLFNETKFRLEPPCSTE